MITPGDIDAVIAALNSQGLLGAKGSGTSRATVRQMIAAALRKLPVPAASGCAWDPGFAYWVDKTYTGGDSDGTPCKPFTTIQEAIDLAWTEVSSQAFDNQAFVFVAGGGTATGAYQETSLLFYPFVNVIGYGSEDGIRVQSAAPIDLYSFGNYNLVNLRFESAWNVPMTSMGFFGFFMWARFWTCRFDSSFTTVGLGANWHWFEFNQCYFGGGSFDVANVTWWLNGTPSYSPLTARSTAAGTQPFLAKDGNSYLTGVFLYDTFQSGDVNTLEAPAVLGVWTETAGRLFGTLTADGPNSTVETTADGYPESGLVLLNGASQYASGNALGLLYEPDVPGNWAGTPPTTVGEAINRLIAATPGA